MELVMAACRQAARDAVVRKAVAGEVIDRDLQSGTPVLDWKDGVAVAMDPRQMLNIVISKQGLLGEQ
jgi:hypothetical protein